MAQVEYLTAARSEEGIQSSFYLFIIIIINGSSCADAGVCHGDACGGHALGRLRWVPRAESATRNNHRLGESQAVATRGCG